MTRTTTIRRSGQSLVEFSLVALALYLLLAGIMEMSRAMIGAQGVQAVADLAAREISRTPLSVSYTSLYGAGPGDANAALNDVAVRQQIFDERLLVIDLDKNPGDPIALVQTFPVVNQQLFSLMIYDLTSVPGRNLLRYPGALVTPGDESTLTALPSGFTDSGYRVVIPAVTGGSAATPTITWVSVLEEITPGAFSITNASTPGMVGIRVNYPYQAAAMSAYDSTNSPVTASDASVSQSNSPASLGQGSLVVPADPTPADGQALQPYGGEFGLGFQQAMGKTVRPFRRLLSAQSVYRREVLTP